MATKVTNKGKLTRAVIDTICLAIARGASYETACKAAGITRRTIYNWLAKAETEGGLYAEFKERIEIQTAKTNVDLAGLIMEAAPKDWRAAEALLRARLPQEYNRAVVQHNHEHQISGHIDHQITIEAKLEALVAQLTPEQLYAIIRPALIAGPEGTSADSAQGGGSQALLAVREIPVPGLSGYQAQREAGRGAGGDSEWDNQEVDYLDASEAWEEPS